VNLTTFNCYINVSEIAIWALEGNWTALSPHIVM
jgi:hypothetical protein